MSTPTIVESVTLTHRDHPDYLRILRLADAHVYVAETDKAGQPLRDWGCDYAAEGFADPQGAAIEQFLYETESYLASGWEYPTHSRSVVGETFAGEKRRLQIVIKAAWSRDFDGWLSFTAYELPELYGRLATAYTSPEVARGILLRFSEEVIDNLS
ncbi:hypothetical protein [Streptomyces exfoliatus]|uniref:hypothetical protein n=1 Tax=Streptomyces exfoliatus TaxID=1905 RepID=UPI003788E717